MSENLRDMMMRAKMCQNCGLVDENGGIDDAGHGYSWYCEEHLNQRDEARLIGSQRVTYSYI